MGTDKNGVGVGWGQDVCGMGAGCVWGGCVMDEGWPLVPIKAQVQLQNSNSTHILGTAFLPLFLYHQVNSQYVQLIWQIYGFQNNLAPAVHIIGNFSNLSICVDLKAGLASFVSAVICPSHACCPVMKLFNKFRPVGQLCAGINYVS